MVSKPPILNDFVRKLTMKPNKHQKSTYTSPSLLMFFLQGSWRFFLLSIVASIAVTALDMLSPRIISFVVDSVLGDTPSSLSPLAEWLVSSVGGVSAIRDALWLPALLIACIAILSAACKYANIYYNTKGAESMMRHMRKSLYGHIQTLPNDWHQSNKTGDIIQRCTSDVDMVRNFVADQMTSVVRIVILVIFALWSIVSIHPRLAIVAFLAIPIILAYSTFFRSRIGHLFEECDENEGVLSTIAQENLTGVRVVRAFGREDYEKDRFERQNQVYTNLWVRLCKYLAYFWSSGDLLSGIQVMLFIVLGAVFCVRGEMTSGEYIAIVSYNAMMIWPVRQLGRVVSEMSKAGVSIGRIKYIMNAAPEAPVEEPCRPDMSGDIEFSHVSYAYEEGKDVLSDVSFRIEGGTVFGILGSTGSGKTTLMYLLDRLCELREGSITVGGVDIRSIDREWLRSHIGMVLQEPFLFSRTLGENLAIAAEDPDMDAIREAASAACLDETVMSFSQGYDTVVGERGVTLSGGQKQRAAIARMLLQNTPIMIFDDSLSAVDAQTDAMIRQRLRERFGGATVILISHRLTTLMQADSIMVLDRGRIAEMGTHGELMDRGGIYRQIYDLQMSGAGEEVAE